jgi:tetratricopeptide (TPR) repeat protein
VTLDEGIDAYERGEYGKARDLCLDALAGPIPPRARVLAHVYLGNALEEIGDEQGASEQFRKALTLDPLPAQRLHLHYKLGLAQKRNGDYEGARTEFEKAIAYLEEPDSAEVCDQALYSLYELAHIYDDRSEYRAVLHCTERAARLPIQSCSEMDLILFDLIALHGRALFWLRRWHESIPILRKALAQLPELDLHVRTILLCYLGFALCGVREYEEAFAILKTIELDPVTHPRLWVPAQVWLGNLYYQRNEWAKAIEHYEMVADLPPEEWAGARESFAHLADCYLETGQYDRALAVAERAYQELRGNALVHVEYAKALAVAGRAGEAEQVLRELPEETVEAGLRERYYAHSVYVAARRGDREATTQWLRKLRDLNPTSRYLPHLEAFLARGAWPR